MENCNKTEWERLMVDLQTSTGSMQVIELVEKFGNG